MATTNIVDKDGNTIAASDATVPSDRHFRNAWTLSGKTITEDLAESKKIFQDKIREVRKPLLDEEDVVYMKALEAGDSSAQTASVAKKGVSSISSTYGTSSFNKESKITFQQFIDKTP